MTTALAPYLNFNGDAKEAMTFYHAILGGKLDVQTFGDANMGENEEEKKLTMHAALTSDVLTLYASDGRPGTNIVFGDSVHLSIMGSDEELLTTWFNALSEGGKIDMPLAKQFWGDTFGMLTDKFGIHWMVNITAKK